MKPIEIIVIILCVLIVGGVIGRNDIQATWLQYKKKNLIAENQEAGVVVYANYNTGIVFFSHFCQV